MARTSRSWIAFAIGFILVAGCSRSEKAELERARAEAEAARAELAKSRAAQTQPTPVATAHPTPAPMPVNPPPSDPGPKPTPPPGPLVFESSLSTPDTLDKLYRAFGQYGSRAVVELGTGLRIAGGHTPTMVWAKPYLGDRYRVQFEVQLKGNEWAGWTLNGPGYGNSPESGYWCRLDSKNISFRREEEEVQASVLPKPIAPGEWSSVQADVSGATLAVTLNGVPVAQFSDPAPLTGPLHGWFGLIAGGSAFRNLRIWSAATDSGRERQLTPPPTEKPAANGELLYEVKFAGGEPGSGAKPQTQQAKKGKKLKAAGKPLGSDWWQSQPQFSVVAGGGLVLSGPNGTPTVVLTKPLPPAVACEVEFEYPTQEAVNFSVMLWSAAKAPQSAQDADGGWLVGLPPGDGRSAVRWHGGPKDAPEKNFGTRAPTLVSTPYYAPVPQRKYLARIETRGDELRVFLDGGLLLTAERPEGAAPAAMPVFLGLSQFYGGSKVHAVRVYQLAADGKAKP